MEFGEQVAESKLTNMSPCNIILFYSAGVHSDLGSKIWKANTMIDMRDSVDGLGNNYLHSFRNFSVWIRSGCQKNL